MPKLTKEVQDAICSAIELGTTYEDAANAARITYRTFRNWIVKGQEEAEKDLKKKTKYLQFFQAVKKAEADAVKRNLAVIEQAKMEGSWQAAAWWLERRYPMKWGKTTKELVLSTDGQKTGVDLLVEALQDTKGE